MLFRSLISYEVALGLSLIPILLLTGDVSFSRIIAVQQEGLWLVFPLVVSFFVVLVSGFAETNRLPFDLPEAESELVAGFHTEYSGFRWSLFFLAEYAAMLAVSSIAVTLWLGGWMRPFPTWLSGSTWELAFSFFPALTFFVLAGLCLLGTVRMPKIAQMKIQTAGLGIFGALLLFLGAVLLITPVRERVQDIYWFVVKVAFFMYLYIWYRGTFPRYRFDQLMKVGWKVLLPTGLGVLIATAVWGLLPQISSAVFGMLRVGGMR